jgi:hypothetical protein
MGRTKGGLKTKIHAVLRSGKDRLGKGEVDKVAVELNIAPIEAANLFAAQSRESGKAKEGEEIRIHGPKENRRLLWGKNLHLPRLGVGIVKAVYPLEGIGRYTFDEANATAPSPHKTQYFEMMADGALRIPRVVR